MKKMGKAINVSELDYEEKLDYLLPDKRCKKCNMRMDKCQCNDEDM